MNRTERLYALVEELPEGAVRYEPGCPVMEPDRSGIAAAVEAARAADVCIAVVGDRVARHVEGGTPTFTDPAPFTTMELRYERAYGGIDV